MSMSMRVVGFRPPDERWQQMKTIWDACRTAGIDPPADVSDFFDGEDPDPHGVEVKLPAREWSDDRLNANGYEVDVAAIPANVTVVRFYASW